MAGVDPVLYIEGSDLGFLALDISDTGGAGDPRSPHDSYVHDVWAGVSADPCRPDAPRVTTRARLSFEWGGAPFG